MKHSRKKTQQDKEVTRTFDDNGRITVEMHSYGLLEIACQQSFAAGKKIAESYFVNKRLVGRARYEMARAEYPDMPEADTTMPDTGAELVKLAGQEKKQKAVANKRRRENPLSEEQLLEAERQIPLFNAATGDDIEALKKLLDSGEDPNAASIRGGFTPLYNACFSGAFAPDKSLAAVRLLLEYRADPNKRFEYHSPIDGRLERGLTALMMAPTAEIAKELLNAGAEVNVADDRGVTPLMRAAGSGRMDVVKVLLEKDAKADAQNVDGLTAADFARMKLVFFTNNIEGCRPGMAEDRINAYREILRFIDERC